MVEPKSLQEITDMLQANGVHEVDCAFLGQTGVPQQYGCNCWLVED
jgi:hypothetical protein